ncbi:MAG TPA: rRNA maturation RNase YbeY [Chromatiaceae bacterium]|nr:rRNA maturation RNase YbeY [Chromatiaceae bacterium]HIA09009.1 rRNA maturation RNase YbeY [Chromatiaceae bacterium]HIO14660.1 rRNA maturation RNase YbeY [Chromatiales bacterium]HIO54860.1 rRNA maturation RNase YbeY [Chromatiales bacterium]
MVLDVEVQYAVEDAGIPTADRLEHWARAAVDDVDASVCIRLVDRPEGTELNQTYRAGEGATNVLSFATDIDIDIDPKPLGDVVICCDVVRVEADEQGKAFEQHLAHMVVHGMLHLCGYDHIKDDEAQVMEARERVVLSRLGYPDPYTG